MSSKYLIILFLFYVSQLNAQWVQMWNGMGQTETVYSLYYSGNNLFAGLSLQGIYVSTNEGLTWSQSSVQYPNSIFSINSNNSNIFACTGTMSGGSILKSSDNGGTWNDVIDFSYSPYCLCYAGNNLIAGFYIDGVYYSTNNGTNWVHSFLNNKTIFSLEYRNNYIVAGTGGYGIYYSTDNGFIWSQSSFNNKTVRSLCTMGQYIYAGTESNGIYRSSDNGVTWLQFSLNGTTILDIKTNGSIFFAGTTNNGVYMSTNNGNNWTAINEGLPNNVTVNSIVFTNNYIVAGTSGASVYRRLYNFVPPSTPLLVSPYNGATGVILSPTLNWQDVTGASTYSVQVSTNSNFSSTVVNTTGLLTTQYIIPAGILSSNIQYYWRVNATNGNGTSNWSETWNFTTTPVAVKNINTRIPNLFALFQNYPNPYNPFTTIRYQISKRESVTLTIYDIMGKEVFSTIYANQLPGTYDVLFDAKSYSSGIYFYKLIAGDFTETKKMVLEK